MSTRSRPEELIEQALEGDLVPLGDYVLRGDNQGAMTTYPRQAQLLNELEQGDRVRKFVDQETGATVTIPVESTGRDE